LRVACEAELIAENTSLRAQLARAQATIEHLAAQVRALHRKIFGHVNERAIEPVCANQTVLDLDLGAAAVAQETAALATPGDSTTTGDIATPAKAAATTARAPRRPRGGIAARCPSLPIVEQEQSLPAGLAASVANGTQRVERTGRFHDVLDNGREEAVIRRTWEVRLVDIDTGAAVLTVPPTPQIRAGGELADRTVTDLVVGKFLDAMPIHRQLKAWTRRGIDVPRQTAGDHVADWCDVHAELAAAIKQQVLGAGQVHADESWFRVQDDELRRRCRRVNVWTLAGGGQVAYHYTEDRTHARAEEVVGSDFRGFLIRDEWPGWYELDAPTHVGCNAHARRPFAALQEIDGRARAMVALYGELYGIEDQAAASGLTGPQLWQRRWELRQKHSRPIMDRIRALAEAIAAAGPPAGELATGARYIIRHWTNLTRFLDHGCLPPDNNWAENCLRIVALIRKNSLFFGSDAAGARAAVALTVLHSCRVQGIDPYHYLADVTPRLLDRHPGQTLDLTALTPREWKRTREMTRT
jgi:hypothetical protein